MNNGWIKLWRKSINSQAFQNESLWKVWTWCLMKANHEESWVPITTGKGTSEILVKPGQFVFGRKTAAKELKMKQSSVRNRIKKLKNIGNLDIQADTHYSLISIINWDGYQMFSEKEDSQQDNQRTAKGQPEDTNNNDKNDKNDKKNIYGEFQNVHLTEEENQKLISKFGEKTTLEKIESLSSYIASKGKKYKSHYATILNWDRMKGNTDDDKKRRFLESNG